MNRRTNSISLILPVHNGGSALRKCLASVARHRDELAEWIVVDDGSTDDAVHYAEELGARVIRIHNQSGPANGRNTGARAARGDILLFFDADICVLDDTISKIRARFEADPELGALIGSYDTDPEGPSLVSQFRNLLHCFVHQTSRPQATTFWAGCGAIRRDIFLAHEGFDISYQTPSIEDIEMGTRLARSGVRIALDPAIQVKHLKRWTFGLMVTTDVRWRGIPWTRLILQAKVMPNDLNLRSSSRFSVALTGALCGLLPLIAGGLVEGANLAVRREVFIWLLTFASLVALNLPFYRFLARHRGCRFAIACVPLHMTYFFCCATACFLGIGIHYCARPASKPGPAAATAVDLPNELVTRPSALATGQRPAIGSSSWIVTE